MQASIRSIYNQKASMSANTRGSQMNSIKYEIKKNVKDPWEGLLFRKYKTIKTEELES